MYRLFLALPLALMLFAAPAHADSSKTHAAAARKAARAHNWNKALNEWQAAYRLEPNSDYLIGMGDAYAGLGDKANARKQYNAYLADPLALDTDGVKAKLANLDKPAADELSLDLGAPAAPAAGANDLDLGAPPADTGRSRKKKAKADVAAADLSLDLAAPAEPSKKAAAANDLSLDLGPAPTPAKKPDSSALSLDIGPAPAPAKIANAAPPKPAAYDPMSLDALGPPAPKPAPHPAPVAQTRSYNTGTKVAVANSPKPLPPAPPIATFHQAPPESVVTAQGEPRVVERNNRVIAYCTAGLAVGALAVGGLYYSKSTQDQTDLTSQVRPGAQQQALIEEQKTNKSLAFAGLLAGVVLAGVTTAIFVF